MRRSQAWPNGVKGPKIVKRRGNLVQGSLQTPLSKIGFLNSRWDISVS